MGELAGLVWSALVWSMGERERDFDTRGKKIKKRETKKGIETLM